MITSITFVGTQSEGSLTIEPGGVPGPTGPKPNHQWTGTSLKFELPNGSWGSSVDLRGPAPAHEWAGTSLKFREPGGDWGDAVDLKGEPGYIGLSAYQVAVAHGFVGDETAWLASLDGDDGTDGWTPVEALVADGDRIVKRIVDWVGGTGTKPVTGKYIGAAGLVDDIGDGVDTRGAPGLGTGTVVGPAGAEDGHMAVFDGATGELIRDGGVPFSGAYADLSGKPALFSGSYDDLEDKPTIPAAQVPADWNASSGAALILNKPTIIAPLWEHIETIDIANLTTSFVINFPTGYDEFDIVFEDAVSGGGAIPFMTFGFRNGSSTTNCDFTGKKRVTIGVTETITEFSAQTFDVINACQFLRARITSPRSSVQYTALDLWGHNGGTNNQLTEIRGISKSASAMDNVVVAASSGSFADVRIRVRGLVQPS